LKRNGSQGTNKETRGYFFPIYQRSNRRRTRISRGRKRGEGGYAKVLTMLSKTKTLSTKRPEQQLGKFGVVPPGDRLWGTHGKRKLHHGEGTMVEEDHKE